MDKEYLSSKIDHSITLVIIVFVILLFSSIQYFAQDHIKIKDTEGNLLISVEDEGTVGSINIPDTNLAPASTTNKLYNINGSLFFNGSGIGGAGTDWQISDTNMYSIPSGNVGIGVISPTSKLEVDGNTKTSTATIGSYGVTIQDIVYLEGNLSGGTSTAINYPNGFDAQNSHILSYKTRGTATDRWYAPFEGDYIYLRQSDILLLHSTSYNTAYQVILMRIN